jgi:ankyrin repeat protein
MCYLDYYPYIMIVDKYDSLCTIPVVCTCMLQEYQVDVNAVVTAEEAGGCALHVAAFLDSANATYELLLLGADILQVDSRGRNPLDIAKDSPTSPVLHILLEHQRTMI